MKIMVSVDGSQKSIRAVKFAKSKKLDLIIMGAKRRSSAAGILIGSVTQRVSVISTIPVLLFK